MTLSKATRKKERKERLFQFLGKIIGKAMYENIIMEPRFSRVFINLILGKSNNLDELYSCDPAIYKSLMSIKHSTVRENEKND